LLSNGIHVENLNASGMQVRVTQVLYWIGIQIRCESYKTRDDTCAAGKLGLENTYFYYFAF